MLVDSTPVSYQLYKWLAGRCSYSILFATETNKRKAASVSQMFISLAMMETTCLQCPSFMKNYKASTFPSLIHPLTNSNCLFPSQPSSNPSLSLSIQYITSFTYTNTYSAAFSASTTSLTVQASSKQPSNFLFNLTISLIISYCSSFRNIEKFKARCFLKLKLNKRWCQLSKIVYLVWFQRYSGVLQRWIQGSCCFFSRFATSCLASLNFYRFDSMYEVLPTDSAPTKKAKFQPLTLPAVSAEFKNCMKYRLSSGQF